MANNSQIKQNNLEEYGRILRKHTDHRIEELKQTIDHKFDEILKAINCLSKPSDIR